MVPRALWGLHVGAVDGIGSGGGHPHSRTLPQLSRFGMNVAQEGNNVLGMCNFK